jgi:O-antigen ligase
MIDRTAVINKALEWSVYIMLLALPFSKSIIEICAAVGVILLVLKRALSGNWKLPGTPGNLPIILIVITTILSLFNSEFLSLSIRALFSKTLKFIVIYYLVVEAISDRTKLSNLLKIGALSAGIVFIDTLLQYFVTHTDILHNYPAFKYVFGYMGGDRGTMGYIDFFRGYPTGPFPFPNDLSAWLLIILPAILFPAIFGIKSVKSRSWLIAFFLVGLWIFVLAKARGAWAGFIIAIGSTVFLIKKKVIIFAILAAMLIIVIFCFATSSRVVFGLSSMIDRGDMWTNSVKIFKMHPIIGNGVNTFFSLYKEARVDQWHGLKGSYSHNCYLQMAADVGILGLAAFLWFVSAVFMKAVRYIKRTPDKFGGALVMGILVGLFAFLIHSAVDTSLYSLPLAALFWLTMGALVAAMKVLEQEH